MTRFARGIIFVLFLAGSACAVFADSLHDYGGSALGIWEFQIKYREKYFEHNIYYNYFNIFDERYSKESAYDGSLLKGMMHNFHLRAGMPENFTANADFFYLYQRLGEEDDYNNLHSVSLYAEKYLAENFGILSGIKIPFGREIRDDVRLIDGSEEFNFIAGVFYGGNIEFFNYSAGLVFEKEITFSKEYKGEASFSCSAGIKVYESKKQSIDIMLETAYRAKQYDNRKETVIYLVPQLRVNFYNDFYINLGVELPAYAESVFLNKFFVEDESKMFYLAEVTYVINSGKRAEKEAPPKEEEYKTWREQDIDREMIPAFWLERKYEPEEKSDEGETGSNK